MLTRDNATGYAVLACLASILSDEEWQDLIVEPYLNGRESGFAVTFGSTDCTKSAKLVFSNAAFRRDRRVQGWAI